MSKKYLTIILIIFLLLSLFATVFLVLKTTVFYQKAAEPNRSSIILENSYLFASPIQAKADGKEKVRITIFLLDSRGIGVPNQQVTLIVPPTVSIIKTQPTSDDSGKTVFDLSATSPNTYEISAQVDTKIIPQKVKVVFY